MPVYRVTVTETRTGKQDFLVRGDRPPDAVRRAGEMAEGFGIRLTGSKRRIGKPVRVSKSIPKLSKRRP